MLPWMLVCCWLSCSGHSAGALLLHEMLLLLVPTYRKLLLLVTARNTCACAPCRERLEQLPPEAHLDAGFLLPHLAADCLQCATCNCLQGGPGAAAARGGPGCLCGHASRVVWNGAAAVWQGAYM